MEKHSVACALYGTGVVVQVDIALHESVNELKTAIFERIGHLISCKAVDLRLYLARKDNKWLEDDDNLEEFLRAGVVITEFKVMPPTWELRNEHLLGPNFRPKPEEIHVLVEVRTPRPERFPSPGRPPSREEPPTKKAKRDYPAVVHSGPVHDWALSVPLDSIDAYREIKRGFSYWETIGHPLYLLYGPRQFGKTTVAYRIKQWIDHDPDLDDVKCIYFELQEPLIESEEVFWKALGKSIDSQVVCTNSISFLTSLQDHLEKSSERLCWIVDELDIVFKNRLLAQQFLSTLRGLKHAPYFLGFLGVGSHDLVYHFEVFNGNTTSSPFNVGCLIRIKPFSQEQMSGFFKLIKEVFPFSFTESLQTTIIRYSSGAPGVFGSLVRFTIDSKKWMLEGSEWERWFQFSSGVFSLYLLTYNNTYGRVQEDLQGLSELEWEALKCVLMRDGEVSSASVEAYCGFESGVGGPKRLVDRLLRMGIVLQGPSGTLLIVSRVMRQIIVEALPVHVITQVATTDDPMLLLKTALRYVRPKAISHVLVSNRESPSESAFHFEIYAAMRDIVKKAKATGRGVHAEVKTPGDKERADIIIANGIKLGYELKVNQLSVSGITSAVAQADRYRLRFDIHHMLVVNFVPKGHVLDEIYHVEAYPEVQVVHIRHDVSCDDFQVCYQRTNGLPVVKEICEPCLAS